MITDVSLRLLYLQVCTPPWICLIVDGSVHRRAPAAATGLYVGPSAILSIRATP
jgi:hypothetical protein